MFHKKVNVSGIAIHFKQFMQLYYKSRFAFKVCHIKIGENIATDELHSIEET